MVLPAIEKKEEEEEETDLAVVPDHGVYPPGRLLEAADVRRPTAPRRFVLPVPVMLGSMC